MLNYTSRANGDGADLEKLILWVRQHNPFKKTSQKASIFSFKIYMRCQCKLCNIAYEIGKAAIEKMKGKSVGDMKLQRKGMVVIQASYNSVAVRSNQVTVNPKQLFNAILCLCGIFSEGITDEITQDIGIVIDGGLLFHCVPWSNKGT
ncbi:hypothetical protein PR048_010063 [Dryococelus australis]|uniref:Uncharacterized protein n=1 Tax=Dryococelus australis TaxID=614101 RepID=A0ABQ9I1R2_9NEOP|nr:hypothetical protein PR048_010063 [Dryococelus australis]